MRDMKISFDKDVAEIKKFLSEHLVLCRADTIQNGWNKGKLRQLFATTNDTFVVKLDGKIITKDDVCDDDACVLEWYFSLEMACSAYNKLTY